MNLTSTVRLLRLLPTRQEDALSVKQIHDRWIGETGSGVTIRTVQRDVKNLSSDTTEGPALLEVRIDGREKRYHLRLSQVAHWFITESASLDLLLARQVLLQSFGSPDPSETQRLYDMAEERAGSKRRIRLLRDKLRVVPDGIGRQRAKIKPEILASVLDAIGANQKLAFHYAKSGGQKSKHLRSPLGLVSKDGTIYLVATEGLSDAPVHFALHRFLDVQVLPHPAQPRPDFDLDRYIVASQQFSHPFDARSNNIRLKLRVAPESIWHFRERPFPEQDEIKPPCETDGWYRVTAHVPDTVLLVPFLLSMGPYIEVVEPESVRAKTAQWLSETSAHYSKT